MNYVLGGFLGPRDAPCNPDEQACRRIIELAEVLFARWALS
ncbi:MAG: hypothetical protein WCL50_05905 [Spirochaetota bacterium]